MSGFAVGNFTECHQIRAVSALEWRRRSGLAGIRRFRIAQMQRYSGARVIRFAQLMCRRFATCLAVVAALALAANGALGSNHHMSAARRAIMTMASRTVTVRHAHGHSHAGHHHGDVDMAALDQDGALPSSARRRRELLLECVLRGGRAALLSAQALPFLFSRTVTAATPATAKGSCPKACAGPQDPSASPDRAQLHCCDADRSIWGCRCSILDSESIEPLVAHVSAPSRAWSRRCCWRCSCPRAKAHEGHDHGPSEAVAGQLAPRVSARSEVFELVGILRGERLVIYLDRFASNEPVTTADIAVTIGDAAEAVNAEWAAEGTYGLTSPKFLTAGPIELVFSITGEAGEDLLAGTLTRAVGRDGVGAGRVHDRRAAQLADVAGLATLADGAARDRDDRACLVRRLLPAAALFRAGRGDGADGGRRRWAPVRDRARRTAAIPPRVRPRRALRPSIHRAGCRTGTSSCRSRRSGCSMCAPSSWRRNRRSAPSA